MRRKGAIRFIPQFGLQDSVLEKRSAILYSGSASMSKKVQTRYALQTQPSGKRHPILTKTNRLAVSHVGCQFILHASQIQKIIMFSDTRENTWDLLTNDYFKVLLEFFQGVRTVRVKKR